MNKYPLCGKAGLKIYELTRRRQEGCYIYDSKLPAVLADDLEKILSDAIVVHRYANDPHAWADGGRPPVIIDKTARLFCIENVKEETAEDILRAIVAEYDKIKIGQIIPNVQDHVKRAKQVLGY